MTYSNSAGAAVAPGRAIRVPSRRRAAQTWQADQEAEAEQVSSRTLRRVERMTAFALPFGAFVVLGAFLALHFHSIYGDAQSRLANGYYVFFSRDPHLSAIGFVWNPLPSIVDMPLFLLKPLFPSLVNQAFDANLVSAACMAATAYQLYRFFEELGLGRLARWGLWLSFCVNPMIIYYGSNGMSESLFLLCLVATARYLARWLFQEKIRDLIIAGGLLGLAYLARNEGAMAAAMSALVVLVASYVRAKGTHGERRLVALTEGALFIAPFVLTFAGWAAVSWIIVGHPFEQLSSVYGTSSQLKLLGGIGTFGRSPTVRLGRGLGAVLSMAPLLPLIAIWALRRGYRLRDARVIAVLSILGGVAAFEVAALVLGQIAFWYRYFIVSVPLAVMLAACAARPQMVRHGASVKGARRLVVVTGQRQLTLGPVGIGVLLGVLAIATVAPGVYTTGDTLLHGAAGSADREFLSFVLQPQSLAARTDSQRNNWLQVAGLAHTVDAMNLGHGQLMVDNFSPCIPGLILDSSHPKQFAIPNDQDFIEKLGVPYQFGVRYIMVPDPSGYGSADALNRAFPELYKNGQGMATLVREYSLSGCQPLRLYRLTPTTG